MTKNDNDVLDNFNSDVDELTKQITVFLHGKNKGVCMPALIANLFGILESVIDGEKREFADELLQEVMGHINDSANILKKHLNIA